jgi:choline dehydrogenase-like flavoprotein
MMVTGSCSMSQKAIWRRIIVSRARFGTDSATSVLDLDCKAHELDNLYIADASFFPSIGAVNPTLTIIANALRVADSIRQRLGT